MEVVCWLATTADLLKLLFDSSTIEQCDTDPLNGCNDVTVESSENLLKIKELLYPLRLLAASHLRYLPSVDAALGDAVSQVS